VFEAAYPDRFLEMGIAEQNLMGVAAGLATVGFVPWLSSFAVFLAKRALDQLRQVVVQPELNVKLAGHYSGLFTATNPATQQVIIEYANFSLNAAGYIFAHSTGAGGITKETTDTLEVQYRFAFP